MKPSTALRLAIGQVWRAKRRTRGWSNRFREVRVVHVYRLEDGTAGYVDLECMDRFGRHSSCCPRSLRSGYELVREAEAS